MIFVFLFPVWSTYKVFRVSSILDIVCAILHWTTRSFHVDTTSLFAHYCTACRLPVLQKETKRHFLPMTWFYTKGFFSVIRGLSSMPIKNTKKKLKNRTESRLTEDRVPTHYFKLCPLAGSGQRDRCFTVPSVIKLPDWR